GKGYSVLEMVKAFERVSGKKIPYKVIGRRPGDVAICFADVSKAKRELEWEAKRGLEEMCADSWKWQSNNKNGYITK
ncbi:GDP-mannose 4,6-dehydratase, partial [Pseudomonas aeruginosa]|nr:GDP-mannose 4,6-dehydratase [Pseudomonas aeruginosa]